MSGKVNPINKEARIKILASFILTSVRDKQFARRKAVVAGGTAFES
jgi:hypothetical protein